MITEAQARFVLRRMGFRLSQRNSGYTILDAEHRIASGMAEDGAPRELTLQEVADWTAAASSAEPEERAPETAGQEAASQP